MYNRNDPRFRRTLNQISQNLESANESAQVGLFSFSEHYVKPCLGSIATYLEPCTAACFPTQRDRLRRQHRTRGTRGRLEHSFDFYDDWEEDENDALLSLEGDEFHRVVGGYGTQGEAVEPLAPRAASMNYGARREALLSPRARKKSAVLPYDSGPDPTVIPNQSYFGFLTKLPFNLGRGGLRYKPSAADLQVRPKGAERFSNEEERLLEEEDEDGGDGAGASQQPFKRQGRNRSNTTGSGHTTDSYSSRGDIFPSDDEDDAVPIDDEFTISLERRTTHTGHEDSGSSKNKGWKRGDSLQPSSDPPSSKSSRKGPRRSRKSSSSTARSQTSDPEMGELASLSALKQEEQRAKAEEEEEVEKKRETAQKLAIERGLATPERIAATESAAPKVEKEMAKPVEALSVPEDDPQLVEDQGVVDVAPGPISMEDNEQQTSPHPRESE